MADRLFDNETSVFKNKLNNILTDKPQADLVRDILTLLLLRNSYKDEKILKRVYNGQDLILKNEVDDHVIIIDDDKEVAIYEKVKKIKQSLLIGLLADLTCIIISILIVKIL